MATLLFMKRFTLFLAVLICLATAPAAQEVTGLAGWDLFLDPGHSQTENQGAFNYSEAENVVRVGLALREMLMTETDVDTVYMSRTNDQQSVGISQRTDHANSVAADFFHSIHSNAAAPNVNHVFVLWAQLRSGAEPAPPLNGGRLMADLMGPLLAQGMRIPASNNGSWGECAFYGSTNCRAETTTPKGSRNWVQSFSMMPSALSEAGFHTNPVQNQRKMNQDWPRLEARAMLWAIYDYHGIERPPISIVTGIIRDAETQLPINGATITIEDRTYTTDTYETVFHRFSNDPDELRNGFYYLEDLPFGTLNVSAEADDYIAYSGEFTINEGFFTFHDVTLLSSVPPFVTATVPVHGEDNHRIIDPIVIEFSRPMNRASVESAFSIEPAVAGSFSWQQVQHGDRRLIFAPHEALEPTTEFVVTISESAEGAAGDGFDGNGDGVPGGTFSLSFMSGSLDTAPPEILATNPSFGATGVAVHPVITITYDEPVNHDSVDGRITLSPWAGGPEVSGSVVVYDVRDRSVISFFPDDELAPSTEYRLAIAAGIEDIFGNAVPNLQQLRFTTGALRWAVTQIDDFETGVEANWWVPQQSGSTTGIVTDSTHREVDTSIYNVLTGSTRSMRLQYGWESLAPSSLIRVHLGGGPPRNVTFGHDYSMQAYIFGDGGGSQFAFSVRDARAAGAPVGRSPWYDIDWYGWRLVTWDLAVTPPVVWAGTGEFGPPYRTESLQLRPTVNAEHFGRIYVDDLRLAQAEPAVSTEPVTGRPERFQLHANFPNPFATITTFRFDLAEPASVQATLYNLLGAEVARPVDGELFGVGSHDVTYDASALASGMYILRLTAGSESGSIRMVIVR